MNGPTTRLFLSVSARPGRFGATVYNELFQRHNIDATYIPRRAPASAEHLIDSIRTLNVAGCSVSAPLKNAVIRYLDEVEEHAKHAAAVNTIVNTDGRLTGTCTDITGVHHAVGQHQKTSSLSSALIFGAGGVVGPVIIGLQQCGIKEITITARKIEAAQDAASRFDVNWSHEPTSHAFDLLVNATPAGRTQNDAPMLYDCLTHCRTLFDLTVSEAPTHVHETALASGLTVIDGVTMCAAQIREQARQYTGIDFDPNEILSIIRSKYLQAPASSSQPASMIEPHPQQPTM
ncbi:MAG: hypothetical protein AAF432_09285 [Planctomycetota bacterium]